MRFLAAAPDPPRSEVDLGAAPLDPSLGWADLVPGAGLQLLLTLVSLAAYSAPTLPSTTLQQPLVLLHSSSAWRYLFGCCFVDSAFTWDPGFSFLQSPAMSPTRYFGCRCVTPPLAGPAHLQPTHCEALPSWCMRLWRHHRRPRLLPFLQKDFVVISSFLEDLLVKRLLF